VEQLLDFHLTISTKAYCFMIEYAGRPIGECWLQEMNLERILKRRPGRDCRRIDITIGEKDYWGRGIGTEAIRLLVEFGFRRAQADAIFALDIVTHNIRSLRAFQKAGFEPYDAFAESPREGARRSFDLVMVRTTSI
jgi:RimJ/RimL family protein N-acetyltransferase